MNDIDFETGQSVVSEESKISYINNVLKKFKNPYIGNKRKLIVKLLQITNEKCKDYQTVLDLFSGGSYVSLSYKMFGKKVISNDILNSSSLYAISLVLNNSISLTNEEKRFLLYNKNDKSWKNEILEQYSDRFTDNEIKRIKSFYNNVEELFGNIDFENIQNDIKTIKTALSISSLQYYINKHCFIGGRMSNNQILAKIDYRLKVNRKEMMFNDVPWVEPISGSENNLIFSQDATELLDSDLEADVCYIDPPYGGLSSNYCELYKFFEECIRKDYYSNIISQSKVLKFTGQGGYEGHFKEMLSKCQKIPYLILSYNDSSWKDIDYITSLVNLYKQNVEVLDFDYSYKYRMNKNNKKISGSEYIIVAK